MTADPLDVLVAAMLDAAEQGDTEGVNALAALADDPDALADWLLTLPPDVLAAAD